MKKDQIIKEKFYQALISTIKVISDDFKKEPKIKKSTLTIKDVLNMWNEDMQYIEIKKTIRTAIIIAARILLTSRPDMCKNHI